MQKANKMKKATREITIKAPPFMAGEVVKPGTAKRLRPHLINWQVTHKYLLEVGNKPLAAQVAAVKQLLAVELASEFPRERLLKILATRYNAVRRRSVDVEMAKHFESLVAKPDGRTKTGLVKPTT